MIFQQRRTAEHFCERLYRFKEPYKLRYTRSDYLPMADRLRQDQYNMEGCLKILLKSLHFYDMDDLNPNDEIIGGMVKSPLQLSIMRSLSF